MYGMTLEETKVLSNLTDLVSKLTDMILELKARVKDIEDGLEKEIHDRTCNQWM